MQTPISVTILTKNSEKYLFEVLAALQRFDEVVICDTGSLDETLTIAKKFSNVTIYQESFNGFGQAHNTASNLAQNDWVLSIDSDEIITPKLAEEIKNLELARGHVYSFPRHNEYRGKWIRYCGWHPDRQIRLYNRLDTSFTESKVHECVDKKGLREVWLHAPLRHYSYDSVADFMRKMELYSSLFAEQYKGKKKSCLSKAIAHGLYAFFKSFFIKFGFLGGQEAFEISIYNANTAFYKYLKLAEANKKPGNKM